MTGKKTKKTEDKKKKKMKEKNTEDTKMSSRPKKRSTRISGNKHDMLVETSEVGARGKKKQNKNRGKLKNKTKFLSMKNINLLPTQTIFKCIHDMFHEHYGKSIYLDTSVQ